MNLITKRDGTKQSFSKAKIVSAVLAAFNEVDGEITEYAEKKANAIADYIESVAEQKLLTIEDIQDLVENGLMSTKRKDVAKAYILYRKERSEFRNLKENLEAKNKKLNALISGTDIESKLENSNKDTRIIPTMRDYIAGFTCKELLPLYYTEEMIDLHNQGSIHLHDSDYSPAMPMTNCCLVNLEDMLNNGTCISETKIDTPTDFRTACTLMTQIAAQVASSQFGGQTHNIAHLAPFVQKSRDRYHKKFPTLSDKQIEDLVRDEIADGIQTIQYQLITMSSTNGQAPFCSLFMYLKDAKNESEKADLAIIIEEILRQRIRGVKNKQGVYITNAFPKLLYVLDDTNTSEDGKYWYLTKLAAECTSKRLVPDYISEKKMLELKGDVYGCMGCRSWLASDPITHKYWGKFNKGVVTINLADAALTSINTNRDFWEVLNERLEICHQAILIRVNRLKGVTASVAPILWCDGAIARLDKDDTIDKLLYSKYSTVSLGYAGLWETVLALTGNTLVSENGREFGKKILTHLNDKCSEWNAIDDYGASIYGTPLEATTEKFAKALMRFPIINGVNDKKYLVNSYHIDPAYNIDAFTKLDIEGELSPLSTGGQISYIETPNISNNIDALLEVIKHIYNTNMYAEINTTTSYCQVCGSTDIKMQSDLKYHCPCCGNDDFDKMNISVRICGYISTNPFNEGRAADIYSRVYHLGDE